jgi:hypothetical protein
MSSNEKRIQSQPSAPASKAIVSTSVPVPPQVREAIQRSLENGRVINMSNFSGRNPPKT